MIRFAALLGLSLASTPALAQGGDVFGTWLIESKRAIVAIFPCGKSACGTVSWLLEPTDANGAPRRDINNPDASQRNRTLCGMPVIGDFTKAADGSWKNGFIYNSEDGKTYKSQMALGDDGALNLRGYVGIPLLGKSQVWTRVSDTRGGC